MQTKDDGKHAILPVARSRDHAGMPVTLPRESDGKMRRDGSEVARALLPAAKTAPSMSTEECTAHRDSHRSQRFLSQRRIE